VPVLVGVDGGAFDGEGSDDDDEVQIIEPPPPPPPPPLKRRPKGRAAPAPRGKR
jgi:hypothetical protein